MKATTKFVSGVLAGLGLLAGAGSLWYGITFVWRMLCSSPWTLLSLAIRKSVFTLGGMLLAITLFCYYHQPIANLIVKVGNYVTSTYGRIHKPVYNVINTTNTTEVTAFTTNTVKIVYTNVVELLKERFRTNTILYVHSATNIYNETNVITIYQVIDQPAPTPVIHRLGGAKWDGISQPWKRY